MQLKGEVEIVMEIILLIMKNCGIVFLNFCGNPEIYYVFLQMNDVWNVPVKAPENSSFKGGREPK